MIIFNPKKQEFAQIEIMINSLYEYNPDYKNVIFILGYNVIHNTIDDFRKKYPNMKIIAFQLEQLFEKSPWLIKSRINFLQNCDEVWDYDQSNIFFLQKIFNIHAKLFTLKYVPELNILPLLPKNKQTIDILFYGSLNDRRQEVLNNIRHLLPNKIIISSNKLWGTELDKIIQKSKIVLNLHFYPINRQEQARIFYLLCNHKCVLSEKSNINYYQNGIIEQHINNIPNACKKILETGIWYQYEKQALKTLILSNIAYRINNE